MKKRNTSKMMSALTQSIRLLGFALMLIGCTVGPDYVAPDIDLPKQYDAAEYATPSNPSDNWWASFNDPVLTHCVQEALKHNRDLEVSVQRIRIARAMRRMESSYYSPDMDAKLSYTVDRLSENSPRSKDAVRAGIFPRDVDYWDAGFDVNWELDVFGGTRRRVEGAVARIEEEAFAHVDLMNSVSAEVARNYFEIRGNQHKLAVIGAQIENEELQIRILLNKHRSGLISSSQIVNNQARQQEWDAQKAALQADIQAGRYRLAVLMGRRPEEAIAGLNRSHPLPKAGGQVPVGLPSELLRRRPDVKASERKLAAATADIGVAKTEFLPRFYLTGSPGLQSGNFADLFSSASSAWMLGPKITWKLFSGHRKHAQLEQANALQTQALIEYEATVIKALEEVESNLIHYGQNARSLSAIAEAMRIRQRDVDIQTMRHDSGVTDALAVAESKVALLDSQWNHIEQQVNLLVRVVALYKSLGGGWENAMTMGSNAKVEN